MKLTDWLDADRGRLKAMALHFDVTQSAVSQWRTNGVPRTRMRAVLEFTGGQVSLEEMLEPASVAARDVGSPAEAVTA